MRWTLIAAFACLTLGACASVEPLAISDPGPVDGPPVLITTKQIHEARHTLEHADAIGFVLLPRSKPSPPADALKLLVGLHGAEDYFAALTEHAEGAPAVYGLCGLYLTGSERYPAELERLGRSSTPVRVRLGCMSRVDPVAFAVYKPWGGIGFEAYCESLVVVPEWWD